MKMGMAGSIFEPHPSNFKILITFKDVQLMLLDFFDICCNLRNPKFPDQSWAHLALVVFGLTLYSGYLKEPLALIENQPLVEGYSFVT